jgi:hypothetical protein
LAGDTADGSCRTMLKSGFLKLPFPGSVVFGTNPTRCFFERVCITDLAFSF